MIVNNFPILFKWIEFLHFRRDYWIIFICISLIIIFKLNFQSFQGQILNLSSFGIMYVEYLRSREKKPSCGEGWVSNPTLRLCGRRGLTRYQDYMIFAFKHLTFRTYLNLVLDFNKQLNCTWCISYFGLKGIILSRDIFNYYSIIVEVNLELQDFTQLTKSSLLLHLVAREWD